MADIFQHFPIRAPRRKVFDAIASPEGLDRWWTLRADGVASLGAEFRLGFGPEYDWRARISRFELDREIEFELTAATEDWLGTRVGFVLHESAGATQVRFHHTGWPSANEHYSVSCHCWALYLRLLRRNLEFGEVVAYEARLDA